MGTASLQVDIGAAPAAVWEFIGDFNGLPRWHPAVLESRLEEGGKLRRLTGTSGRQVVERLLELDEDRRVCRYSIIESGLPIGSHSSRIEVAEHGEGSRVIWSCEFESKGPPEAVIADQFKAIYSDGLANLKDLLED